MSPLNPPQPPFLHRDTTPSPTPSRLSAIPILGASTSSAAIPRNVSYDAGLASLPSGGSSVSLSVNYLPSKFSSGMLSLEAREGARRRRGGGIKGGVVGGVRIPKMGGGREAFGRDQARMAGEDDEDEDDEFRGADTSGDTSGTASSGHSFWKKRPEKRMSGGTLAPLPRKKMRWNRFKWTLCVANTVLSLYSVVALVVCLLVWFDAWTRADIVRVGNTTELVISTVASLLGLFTSLIGWAGLLMNNRMFLAIYTFLCWVTFAFLVVPGYLTYKKRVFNLEGKINAQWSRSLGASGRLRIQDQLGCCGYYSPYVEATVSQTCYSRSILPGCKKTYMEYEDGILKRWYIAVFALVPVHVGVMVAGLLCSNHVTYRFGKGMMPKAYRLSLGSMGVIMDQYAHQLAEQYGNEVATDIITRSKSSSQLGSQLDVVPKMPYLGHRPSSTGTSVTKIEPYSPTK
ncbi:tetraspanin Tsp2 [Ephemerocybe angulata]|uniref:Tetraspanin Tsp2 n=1 Tax=Ephemerocybe angulata TaxID=980116 RepID=A0A8H6IHB7_9AGAR|nr:tetraspanin Tsp2 [Tulosesus angulatus]